MASRWSASCASDNGAPLPPAASVKITAAALCGALLAASPQDAPASRPAPVVVRAAGQTFTKEDAFDSILFHHRDAAIEVLRKLAGDAIARAECERLQVTVPAAEVDEGVQAAVGALRERVELEFGKDINFDDFLERDLLTTRADYEASVRRFVEASRRTAYLVRYDQMRTERLVARHIVVADRTKAEQLLADLRAGADFRVLAKQQSLAPSKSDGGKLPPFDREFTHPLVAPAFGAVVGELCGPIDDLRGPVPVVHIFQVLERLAPREEPFEAVRAELARGLKERPIDRFEFDAYVRKQSKRYPAEILGRRPPEPRAATRPAGASAPSK